MTCHQGDSRNPHVLTVGEGQAEDCPHGCFGIQSIAFAMMRQDGIVGEWGPVIRETFCETGG